MRPRHETDIYLRTVELAVASPGRWIEIPKAFRTPYNASKTAQCLAAGYLRVEPREGDIPVRAEGRDCIRTAAPVETKVERSHAGTGASLALSSSWGAGGPATRGAKHEQLSPRHALPPSESADEESRHGFLHPLERLGDALLERYDGWATLAESRVSRRPRSDRGGRRGRPLGGRLAQHAAHRIGGIHLREPGSKTDVSRLGTWVSRSTSRW
jgi:hypothetical protein